MKSNNEIMRELTDLIKTEGLDEYSGSLLYSGLETISPGPLYILGYNPGGNPDKIKDTPICHLKEILEKPRGWNEYRDGQWENGNGKYDAGEAPMQKRVKFLIEKLECELSKTCASNLIFVRSRDINNLSGANELAKKCWPVHQFILEKVKPKVILSIGGRKVIDFILSKNEIKTDLEEKSAGHGNWKCYATNIQIRKHKISLISVPHLSRYAIDINHPDVIEWIQCQTRQSF